MPTIRGSIATPALAGFASCEPHPVVNPATDRRAALTQLAEREHDLLVVGGGITGAGVARDAALRGLRVALVERDDFAGGTSSRSSRLIHGGVRYLEHGHLGLVFEASRERRILLRTAPHLVRPLAFTWPVYRGARVPRWQLAAGLALYDALALFRNVGLHRPLGARRGARRASPRSPATGCAAARPTATQAPTTRASRSRPRSMRRRRARSSLNHAEVRQLDDDGARHAGPGARSTTA